MTKEDLINLRTRFKLSRAKLADALGCSAKSIENWESGKYEIPKCIALAASAFVMGIPPYSSGTINS